MNRIIPCLVVIAGISFIHSCNTVPSPQQDPPAGFYAYHTDLNQGDEPYNRYKDLVVVLGEGKRLEFARETGYSPRWVTPHGTYSVDQFFPEKDRDINLDYTYVRLLNSNDEKIIVHWRYIPDIARIDALNDALDPVNMAGLQAAVHEIFSISQDGTVHREMRDAEETRREDWLNPATVTRQKLLLQDQGIEHGEIERGEKNPILPRPGVVGNPVKSNVVKDGLLGSWTFDEGMQSHEDQVFEQATQTACPIEGSMSLFKKGVSGTALAFDGYYTGIRLPSARLIPENPGSLTVESWVALDAYPYNDAAVVHQSTGLGEEGFFLGIDPYGYVVFRIGGQEVKSRTRLKYGEWAHIGGIFYSGKLAVVMNGKVENETDAGASLTLPDTDLQIGRNNEKKRCTDYVRDFDQNITYVYSIQGLIDEVRIYGVALAGDQIALNYANYKPAELKSDLALGVLPGEAGTSNSFGATYESLKFSEIWDGLWRNTGNDEVIVRFDDLPTSVIFWKGTNYAANWVTDNNRWFADQSSEIWGPHGCSEHMADKQNRMCYARIIESSPARVVVHWRYPCVDVGYVCNEERNWSDEYHTFYPDGTGVRKVYWNGNKREIPGFQDIQMLTNPGESALDVVHLQALSMANRKGETYDLTWSPPNIIPEYPLEDADIELINSKSEYKVFLVFQGACFTPWGEVEQSEYTEDPFAGPWNHWPMHLVPSDGRFAVDHDRVTHFALAANDCAPEFGSMVMYGFTNRKINSVVPMARSWQTPPEISEIQGAVSLGFDKVYKSFEFKAGEGPVSFSIESSPDQPVVNPCFVIRKWNRNEHAVVLINGEPVTDASSLGQGVIRDVDGTQTLVVWTEFESTEPVQVEIGRTGLSQLQE